MAARPEAVEVSRPLAEAIGCTEADRVWLGALLELFPVPTAKHVHHLIFALGRIRDAAHWWPTLLGDEDFVPSLTRVEHAIRAAHAAGRLQQAAARGGGSSSFSGDFRLTGTLLPDARLPRQPSGLECLRAILVGCCWRWAKAGAPRKTAVDHIASAIRGAMQVTKGKPAGLPGEFLARVGGLLGEPQLSALPEVDEAQVGQTFAAAWNRNVVPTIRDVLSGVGQANLPGPELPAPPPPVSAPPGSGTIPGGDPGGPGGGKSRPKSARSTRAWPRDDERSLRAQAKSYRRRLTVPDDGTPVELEPGESVEEVAATVEVLPAEFVPRNRDAAAVAVYQVQQAIWGRNALLIPNHADVLPLDRLRQACALVLGALQSADLEAAHRPGLLGLLLQALTGRTAESLTSLNIGHDATDAHNPRAFDLLLDEGMLRYSVFWQVGRDEADQPSFFRPDENVSLHLEPSGSVYLLPLMPLVADVLRQNREALLSLAGSGAEAAAQRLRDAAVWLSDKLNWQVTSGQVRRSFSTHLFEQCRDSALTQLLAADSFGSSVAPSAYFAPTVRTVAGTYWAFQQSVLQEEPPMPSLPDADMRVGSKLMASRSSATAMVRSIGAPFRLGVKTIVAQGDAHRVHMGMVCQMTGLLVAALTHRPTAALLALTRSDFLIERNGGAALFRDKVIDGAHDPRLVVLPQTACRQFEAYLAHLVGLAQRRPALQTHIYGVLRGERPLFFAWDGEDGVAPLSLNQWKEAMPTPWHELPFNWGRHWCRTRAVELGLRSEFVNIQMGHLETVGYPFSGASPTTPAEFADEFAAGWEKVVRDQGWSVLKGLQADETAPTPVLPPLTRWADHVKEHEARSREQARRWREEQRARMRSYRAKAEEQVLAHDALVKAGITEIYRNSETGQPQHGLTRTDFERLRDEFLDSEGESSLAMGLAKAAALCRIARAVNRRTLQPGEDPAPLFFPRRPIDNAFVPGMMTAVAQVRSLREHLGDWSEKHKPGPKDDFPLACARVVLALMLFGYCDNLEKIRGAIVNRHAAVRSASIRDLLIVSWGAEPGQVLALRGVAAIALAKLARKFPGIEMPDWEVIAPLIPQFLPDWVVRQGNASAADPVALAEALRQTVSVVNRYELSPAARLGLAEKGGCVEAHSDEQIALLDGDPPGTLGRDSLKSVGDDEEPAPSMAEERRLGSARTQYLALCAIFPTTSKNTRLPLTGWVIPSGQAADGRHRERIVAEIDAMLAASEPARRLQPVVRLLAAWCRDMLTNGTERRENPPLSTVETYLSRIGGALVHILGHRRLALLDEAELEEAYLAAVEYKEGDPAQAATTLIWLHRFGRVHFGLPDADLTSLYVLAGKPSEAKADARLILPSERRQLLKLLDEQLQASAANAGAAALEETRCLRQARVGAEILVGAGARRSEVLGLEIRNVAIDGERATIRIRPNPSRRLKTPSARRDVQIRLVPASAVGSDLHEWVAVERGRMAKRQAQRAYLFAPLDQPRSAEGRDQIAQTLLKATREATRLDSARLHQLRHLTAIELLTPIFLSDADREALATALDLRPTPTWRGGVALPRDLRAQAVTLGHADPKTTLAWYYHVPVLLRSRSDEALMRRHLNVNTLATLLGVTRDAVRWPVKQAPGVAPAQVWMDHEIEPRIPSTAPQGQEADLPPQSPTELAPWTAKRLGELLTMTERTGALEPALAAIGADPAQADLLRAAILPIELRLGRRLLKDASLAKVKERPKRRIRPASATQSIERLWDEFDHDVDGQRAALTTIAHAVCHHMSPRDADRIRLPSAQMPVLMGILLRVGIEESDMKDMSVVAGMSTLRIPRRVGARTPGEDDAESGAEVDADDPQAAEKGKDSSRDLFIGLTVKRVLAVIALAGERGARLYP